ncbi:MAG TPA: hypothetical protein VLE47_01905 [Candidatus Saccharimonadales bacterium]|nr:hypothetical protein [Candidatus Saccharimonadales bacterium]
MKLERLSAEPILAPTKNWWENQAVFNPGATLFEDKIILLYRAVGGDHISRFGLAESSDGINFTRRKEPIFEADLKNTEERLGIEDPRITKLGEEYLITYTGTSVYPAEEMKELTWQRKAPWKIRTFLTRTKNFQNFSHEELILDFDTKDTALFPEQIAGRYVLLHRVFPDMNIIYSEDLSHWSGSKKILNTREGYWDSTRVGGGSPPFKTSLGWLHFYHGVDDMDRYQLGVMIHDLENPEKILYRADEPIFSPETSWEKEGNFPNVVFSCGAIEKDGQYIVYYGAADKVIGAAAISKEKLLSSIDL